MYSIPPAAAVVPVAADRSDMFAAAGSEEPGEPDIYRLSQFVPLHILQKFTDSRNGQVLIQEMTEANARLYLHSNKYATIQQRFINFRMGLDQLNSAHRRIYFNDMKCLQQAASSILAEDAGRRSMLVDNLDQQLRLVQQWFSDLVVLVSEFVHDGSKYLLEHIGTPTATTTGSPHWGERNMLMVPQKSNETMFHPFAFNNNNTNNNMMQQLSVSMSELPLQRELPAAVSNPLLNHVQAAPMSLTSFNIPTAEIAPGTIEYEIPHSGVVQQPHPSSESDTGREQQQAPGTELQQVGTFSLQPQPSPSMRSHFIPRFAKQRFAVATASSDQESKDSHVTQATSHPREPEPSKTSTESADNTSRSTKQYFNNHPETENANITVEEEQESVEFTFSRNTDDTSENGDDDDNTEEQYVSNYSSSNMFNTPDLSTAGTDMSPGSVCDVTSGATTMARPNGTDYLLGVKRTFQALAMEHDTPNGFKAFKQWKDNYYPFELKSFNDPEFRSQYVIQLFDTCACRGLIALKHLAYTSAVFKEQLAVMSHVISIGTGPGADLAGIKAYLIDHGKRDPDSVEMVGYDCCDWRSYFNFGLQDPNIKFIQRDVMNAENKFFNSLTSVVDLALISYTASSIGLMNKKKQSWWRELQKKCRMIVMVDKINGMEILRPLGFKVHVTHHNQKKIFISAWSKETKLSSVMINNKDVDSCTSKANNIPSAALVKTGMSFSAALKTKDTMTTTTAAESPSSYKSKLQPGSHNVVVSKDVRKYGRENEAQTVYHTLPMLASLYTEWKMGGFKFDAELFSNHDFQCQYVKCNFYYEALRSETALDYLAMIKRYAPVIRAAKCFVSLGCGPCGDLDGVKKFVMSNRYQDIQEVVRIGYDVINWNEVIKDKDIMFIQEDISTLDFIDDLPDNIDIIIMAFLGSIQNMRQDEVWWDALKAKCEMIVVLDKNNSDMRQPLYDMGFEEYRLREVATLQVYVNNDNNIL